MLTIATLILVAWWWWLKFSKIPYNFPLGPYGLPLIGYWPVVFAENILVGLEKLHVVYGSVFSLNIGPSRRVVIIGDYEILKVSFLALYWLFFTLLWK